MTKTQQASLKFRAVRLAARGTSRKTIATRLNRSVSWVNWAIATGCPDTIPAIRVDLAFRVLGMIEHQELPRIARSTGVSVANIKKLAKLAHGLGIYSQGPAAPGGGKPASRTRGRRREGSK